MKIMKQQVLITTLTTALVLLSAAPVANAGLPSCFDSTEYQPITEQELQARVNKKEALSAICYRSSLCLAKGEKLLTKKQLTIIEKSTSGGKGTRYTEQFREIMNLDDPTRVRTSLNDINDINTLKLSDISQSGFINVKTLEGQFVEYIHTAYIQVTADGKQFLYTANGGGFDTALMGTGETFVKMGSTKRFALTDSAANALNDYFKANPVTHEPQKGFAYTPAEEAAYRASAFGNNV